MKMSISGEEGTHGRNYFFIESGETAFLLDGGTIQGPTAEQIKAAGWLFVSRSHINHNKAYDWLCENGFDGTVVMTRETAQQVKFSPQKVCIIDELTPAMESVELEGGISVMWGRSGQCTGSCWYNISVNGENILFSGDYVEDTLSYKCDEIRGIKADFAILDSAYGNDTRTPEEHRVILANAISDAVENEKLVVLPVPKYGHWLEILLLLRRKLPHIPFLLDTHLRNELSRIDEYYDWIRPEFFDTIKDVHFPGATSAGSGIMFFSDPQLEGDKVRRIAEDILSRGGKVIFTGSEYPGSYGNKLVEEGRAINVRYAVHMNDTERTELERVNSFDKVILCHN